MISSINSMLLLLAAVASGASGSEAGIRVGSIRLFGNQRIKPYIILREMPFKQGDIFNQEDIKEAKERIRKVPGVDYSEVRVSYIPQDSAIVVTVIITEKPTLHGYLLTSRGFENKLSFGIKAVESNFRGRSERLFALVLFRGNTVLEAGWENPWIGRALHLGVGLKTFYKNYQYVYGDFGGVFNGARIERSGGILYLFHTIGVHTRLSLKGGFETVKGSTKGVTAKDKRDSYATVALCLLHDSRNSMAFPWDASLLDAKVEAIGPGDDDLSIIESTIDVRKYSSIFSRYVFALQATFTARNGKNIPIYRREHLGGARTLRGYDYGTFHGKNSVVTGAECRIPVNFSKQEPLEDLLLGISFHFFAETAAAWEREKEFSTDIFHPTFGLGLSLLTKNATGIRFDYAWHRRSSGRWEIDAGLKF